MRVVDHDKRFPGSNTTTTCVVTTIDEATRWLQHLLQRAYGPTHIGPIKAEVSVRIDRRQELQLLTTEEKLKSSEDRVKQLEGWLNEAATELGGCDLDRVANAIRKKTMRAFEKSVSQNRELLMRISTNEPTERWVEWCEPFGPNNEPVYMHTKQSVVIAKMKQAHPELTDEQALDEFLVVNWATLLERK